MAQARYVLDEDATIPIVGWGGPSGDMIRPEVMRDMAEAGFTVSVSQPDPERMVAALDTAAAAGVRLILQAPGLDLGRMEPERGRGYALPDGQKAAIRELVIRVKDHPGLYGYYVHDEPNHADYDWIAAVIREIESLDPYHMCYVNHNAPVVQCAYGAGSQEALWKDWIRKTRPRYLSYDHYPIEQKPQDFIRSLGPDAPNVFGRIVVKPSYFSALAFVRSFAMVLDLPLWAFTCSVPHWSYPPPTEGHIRFQLMCDLAYGARGLQYFTYAAGMVGAALVRRDGTTTETWEIARRVNRDIHALWRKLRGLRSIGVYHTGPLWPGTEPPMPTPQQKWGPGWKPHQLTPTFTCTGDPAVIGLFSDPAGQLYVLVVNRNPVEGGSVSLDPGLHELTPHKWHPLGPGEGRLFRLRADGPPEAVDITSGG